MKRFRAAVIGCGRIGSSFDKAVPVKEAFSHAGAYHLCPGTQLVAAADPDADKRGAFSQKWNLPASAVHADYRDMLKREEIDILSVSTPPETHWPVIREACKHRLKAIYCEKPIADNVTNARKIVALCRQKKIRLVVNHQRRFGAFYQEVRRKLADGSLGTVQQAGCLYTRGIANTCTHMIDLFVFWFGPIDRVSARFSRSRSPFPNDPNLDAVLRFKSGLELSLKACDDQAFLILETDIVTTRARIRMGETLEYLEAKPGTNLLGLKELAPAAASPFAAVYPRYGMVPLDRGVAHVVDCLKTGKTPLSTGESGAHALAVIEALLKSAQQQRKTGRLHEVKL